MAFFGRGRDVAFMTSINREHVGQIIEQYVGYYKINLEETEINSYGEGINKSFYDPVLVPGRIRRGAYETLVGDPGIDRRRSITVSFFKPHLTERGVFTESGDIMLWNEEYYEVDTVNENQLIVGKDPEYHYKDGDGVEDSGFSLSVIVTAHYTDPERLGLKEERI